MHTLQLSLGGATLASLVVFAACNRAAPPEVRLRRMGEHVTIGSLVYNVFEDQWKTELGQGSDTRVPKERFFLIRVSVLNSGSKDFLIPSLTLVDDGGQTYPELTNGDQVPQWTGYIRRVKPAETLQGNVVFDVPPKHYRLRVTDEDSQKNADIDIPLQFASETPDLPTQQ
jgi:hypothetical protein